MNILEVTLTVCGTLVFYHNRRGERTLRGSFEFPRKPYGSRPFKVEIDAFMGTRSV